MNRFFCALMLLALGVNAAEEGSVMESLPLDPAAALLSIHVPEGYLVELMAAEPLVQDPVAFDWDAEGRLWVVEMADYPMGMEGKGASGGRVRLLEDRDFDGRYEHATVFAKGLNFPNGILTWRDGVIVTAAPDVLFLRDTDGDGVADEREVLLTGLSEGNQQLRANGLRWGLDNWVYVAAGGHHGKHALDTKVRSTRNNSEVAVGSRDFRFRPDSGVVDPQSGPSQFGRNRDDWGRWFGVQNSRPLWHYVLPDHYLRRNPQLAAPDGRVQLPGKINPPVYPASKAQKRFHSFGNSGHYTSACSGMIYRDDYLFGSGGINGFSCEPFHNLAQRIELMPMGVSFSGKRGGKEGEPDFFASSDRWCRPVMARTGPDGCLWVADMYRYMIEHPQWLPEEGKKELLPFYRRGDDQGRIYRVRRADRKPRAVPRLGTLEAGALVAKLNSPNGWVRDKVHQLVLWRSDRKFVPMLEALVSEGILPQTRVQALCILDGLHSLDERWLLKALKDDHARVRENALRVAEEHVTPRVVTTALKMAEDSDPKVRMQLSFSIGAFPQSRTTGEALARLLLQDPADHFVTIAVLSSALPHLEVLTEALGTSGNPAVPQVARPLIEVMLRAGKLESVVGFLLPVFEKAAQSFSAETVMPCVELVALLEERQPRIRKLMQDGAVAFVDLRKAHLTLLAHARKVIADDSVALVNRLAAAALLAQVPEDLSGALEFLESGLVPATSLEELKLVFKILAGTRNGLVPEIIFRNWESLSPVARGLAIDQISTQEVWTRQLVDALGADRVHRADFDPTRRLRLLNHPNKAIRETAAAALQIASSPARTKVVESYWAALSLKGNAKKGVLVFNRSCVACHRHGKLGREVGPDLRTVSQHPPEKLLVNILDPNLDIQPGYHAFNCKLKSGETLFGLLGAESAVSITLKLPDATTRVLLRSDIATLKSVDLSLMPEGLEVGMTKQDLADLIAFLKSQP